jgi:hypothetical protein
MFAPIGITCADVPAVIGRRTAPLSGIARTPYSEGDIQAGGSISQIGRIRPATKSECVSSRARTRAGIHSASGTTSSSVNATISPRVTCSAAFTACDLPGCPTQR